jgi:hypothetical protein
MSASRFAPSMARWKVFARGRRLSRRQHDEIPVMIELFHQVREGRVRLDEPLVVKNEFHSLAGGSIYTLDPADDSETELYKAVGKAAR